MAERNSDKSFDPQQGVMKDLEYHKRLLIAGGCAALAVLILLMVVLSTGEQKDRKPSYEPEAQKLNTAGKVMGHFLRKQRDDSRVLLITRPERSHAFHKKVIRAAEEGLESGLKDTGSVEAVEGVRFTRERAERLAAELGRTVENIDKWLPPLAHWYTPDVLYGVVQRHPECNVVVSMVGIPYRNSDEVEEVERLFSFENSPPLLVLHGPVPSPQMGVRSLFKSGTLMAAVVRQNCLGYDYNRLDKPALLSRFEENHTMMTAENLNKVVQRCGGVFEASRILDE